MRVVGVGVEVSVWGCVGVLSLGVSVDRSVDRSEWVCRRESYGNDTWHGMVRDGPRYYFPVKLTLASGKEPMRGCADNLDSEERLRLYIFSRSSTLE